MNSSTHLPDGPGGPSTSTPTYTPGRAGAHRRARGARFRLRAAAAVATGRATGSLTRRLGVGGGTSLPGLLARALDPRLTSHLSAQLRGGSVVVTGTNGKTTTSGLIASVLRECGLRVWRNREGSNLARGITAALMKHATFGGQLRERGDAAFVFEVDEAAFGRVVTEVQPEIVTVTNLFRDQLDRYGEVDSVAERWRESLQSLPEGVTLVLNADDAAVAALADGHRGPIVYFGVEDAPGVDEHPERVQVIDTRTCPRCRTALEFSRRFYSHVGHWACPGCGFSRPTPSVSASAVSFAGLDGSRFTLRTAAGATSVDLALPGLYNVYNALAGAAVGTTRELAPAAIATALGRFTPAFGRAERIQIEDHTVHLLLAKNPTGLNEVLRALTATATSKSMLLILNDRAADGEDVSWIWDADFEQVAGIAASVVASGTRAYDLALRLKYAGAPVAKVTTDIAAALTAALEVTPVGEPLYVVPTYTAMLAVRGEIERRGYAPRYWEQDDDA